MAHARVELDVGVESLELEIFDDFYGGLGGDAVVRAAVERANQGSVFGGEVAFFSQGFGQVSAKGHGQVYGAGVVCGEREAEDASLGEAEDDGFAAGWVVLSGPTNEVRHLNGRGTDAGSQHIKSFSSRRGKPRKSSSIGVDALGDEDARRDVPGFYQASEAFGVIAEAVDAYNEGEGVVGFGASCVSDFELKGSLGGRFWGRRGGLEAACGEPEGHTRKCKEEIAVVHRVFVSEWCSRCVGQGTLSQFFLPHKG